MLETTFFPYQSQISLLLLLASVVVFFLPWVAPKLAPLSLRYWGLSAALLFIAASLIAWKLLLLIGSAAGLLIGGLAIFGYFLSWREQRYARDYPVFASSPALVARSETGQSYQLHVAPTGNGFLIGISYEQEIDSSTQTVRTRWTTTYPTYELAEVEVIKRGQDLAARHGTPNPSIERTCPGKPGQASHVKR
jgi:hypothetical protein